MYSIAFNESVFKINTKIFEFAMKIMQHVIGNVTFQQLLYRPVKGSEVCRRSRLPDFETIGTLMW